MRLPDIDPQALSDDQQKLYDTLMGRPEVKALGLVGPFGVWMHAPNTGAAMSRLGAQVRFATTLPAAVSEVAICTTGAFYRSEFEFAAHRTLALAAGVGEAQLDRLAAGEDPGFEGDEAAAHTVATELLADHAISDATYADAQSRFGDQGVVELVTTIGYYVAISLTLNGFAVALPDHMTPPF
jgi:4-carboxymuconolactone decarboxylase